MQPFRLPTAFLACLVLLHFAARAQSFTGIITDARTGQGVPFANVGVVGKALGTVADEQGRYRLSSPPALADETVRLSSLGYEVRNVPLRQLAAAPDVKLAPAAVALQPVLVTAKSAFRRPVVLGNTGESDMSASTLSAASLGAEVGTVIHLKRRPTRVLTAHFNIARTSVGTVTFRVNFYRLDKHGRPSDQKLLARDVFVTAPVAKGTLTVDLQADNFVVDDDFLLSVEMIRWERPVASPAEVTFSAAIGYGNNQIYTRPASQGAWERNSVGALLAGMQPKISFFVKAQD